ncbi:MAG: diaminopimelate epimerase [Hungatella sp.]
MKFTKMQGAGNDYVYINCLEAMVANPSEVSRKVSDRHFGIGSDGLVLICPSQVADCRMRMFNADGSEGEMCGNAIRCVGKYVYDHNLIQKECISVETLGGIKQLRLMMENGRVKAAQVDMGIPIFTSKLPEAIAVDGKNYEFIGVDMGCPHAVYFTEDVEPLDLEHIGPAFEHHERFPNRVNTEFVQVMDRTHIRMRVWERGSGETLACGTGASASAAASILMGYTDHRVEVSLRGGVLLIDWDTETNHLYMTGPAVEVFHGEIEINY